VRGGSRHCASEALGRKAIKARTRRSLRIIAGEGNTFFQINKSMTAHHSEPGLDLSRAGVEGSQVTALPQLCAKLLPPTMVEAILAGRQPAGVTLPALMEPFAVEWHGLKQPMPCETSGEIRPSSL
jgi:hypothetical protein